MVRSAPVAPVEERSGVFVSYARADGETFGRKLADNLGALGLDVWMDRLQMLGGRNWWQQIADAIGCAAFIVVVMTPEAVSSETVRREWDYVRKEGVCVFPVKAHPDLDFSAMPTWMSDRHFYDLGHEWDAFVSQLHGNCEAERVPFMAPELPEGGSRSGLS